MDECGDAAASVKSDLWKRFGFLVSKDEKRRPTDGKQSVDMVGLELIHTYGTLRTIRNAESP